jgi:benzoyl-CoA reductase/2-hydroxyglutaryl-CoA dehydratase subunit BcrC/BadD/HgdB
MEILEESGGKVVADDLCTGFRHFFPPGGEGQSPLDQLIDRYINRFPCPSRTRARNRSPLIIELIRRSGSSGVIFLFQKFCTPHLADHPIITEALRRENIHSIMIEMEETGINEGQLRTRFEGFFEMLRG